MNDPEKLSHLLCPPGNGVYTVHTGREFKEPLHNKLYQSIDPQVVIKKWKESINFDSKKPLLLGVCSDSGGGIHRGANWGPLMIRNRMVTLDVHEKFHDIGDVKVIPHLLHDKYLNKETINECQNALYNGLDLPVSPLSITESVTDIILKNKTQFIALGGDHSVSYPLVKQWIKNRKEQGIKVAIIHFDAHTDLLDKRLGIDICFGSWAYHIIQELDSPDLLIQLGIRSSGQDKSYWENKLGIKQFWTNEIQAKGIVSIADEINEHLKNNKVDELYISFDIDSIDSDYVSATGTPEPSGLYPHEAVGLIKLIGGANIVHSADLVEVAPFVNFKDISNSMESTINVSVNIIEALLEQIKK